MRLIAKRGHTILICEGCGSEFMRPNAHIRSNTHACSRECSYKIKKKRPKIMLQYICKYCGISFERRKGRGGTCDFCSPKCRIAGVQRPSGEDHHNWKGGIAERKHEIRAIIEKKKKQIGKCEECESTEKLEGHHILRWSEFPEHRYDPNNIQILCRSCHAAKHPDIAFTGKAIGRTPNRQLHD
jgi:5-methylcytosine-specific restriction endonuclease McrA